MKPISTPDQRRSAVARVCWLVIVLPIACAGPGPDLFPMTPVGRSELSDGWVERTYDTDRDGRPDYAEHLSPEGRIGRLRYGIDQAGSTMPYTIDLSRIDAADYRHLLIILDSIPYAMVRDLWNRGRFRLFHPPTRVISPFPAMTDLCLSEFFGVSPCPGVESEYYDGRTLTNGYLSYADEVNTPWLALIDYHMNPIAHSLAYPKPHAWFDHELRRIQRKFYKSQQSCFVGYCVGPSALGAKFGRDGHQVGLVRLDRFCQEVVRATRGKVQITLMSDHGHNLVRSRRIPLAHLLRQMGYRVGKTLERPGDVVVPEFGVVTCAPIHTREPAAVARDVVGLEGIDLAAYRIEGTAGSENRIVVLSREDRATISRSHNGYRYAAEAGDPLRLLPILARLQQEGGNHAEGFIADRILFEATKDHPYPDVVHRLWRAFHGLVENTPDVLVSVKDGWHCGSALMSDILELSAAHGSLGELSSTAFAMTTAGTLEPVLRMEDLLDALVEVGMPRP